MPGAVIWARDASPEPTRILPDGCMDLIFDGRTVFVAGPDSTARWHRGPGVAGYTAVRFHGGLGTAMIGVPAEELRDRSPDLAALWPERRVRELAESFATGALERWLVRRARHVEFDPLGPALLALAAAGTPVSDMAGHVGLSSRQLHRRARTLFGYGPRHLVRVLRMSRALDRARTGMPLAQVAAVTGYSDQAHLTRDVRELAGTTPARLLRESAG